jgi:uncharacterized SAM-binding protein YcdF (DUF218 family)
VNDLASVNRVTTDARTVRRRVWRVLACFALALVVLTLATLAWGGYLLVTSDVLPSHADGAIVLQASVISEDARIDGAVSLLQRHVVDEVLISIPKTGYWGLSFPDLARTHLEKQYGKEIAGRFDFCVIGPGIDSTEQEAQALVPCIEKRAWHSVIVVTSNFHGRRAGMIWRKTWKAVQPPVHVWIDGVDDPLFRPNGWWRHRAYAKTWFFEITKLIWIWFT